MKKCDICTNEVNFAGADICNNCWEICSRLRYMSTELIIKLLKYSRPKEENRKECAKP